MAQVSLKRTKDTKVKIVRNAKDTYTDLVSIGKYGPLKSRDLKGVVVRPNAKLDKQWLMNESFRNLHTTSTFITTKSKPRKLNAMFTKV